MLTEITNWSDLLAALEAAGLTIYRCEACKRPQMVEKRPTRCKYDGCRSWADSAWYGKVGRPRLTCPRCGSADRKMTG